MPHRSLSADEIARLAALDEYGVTEALADPGFDRLVQLAANVFDVPIALVSLVESERQIFAARVGLDVCETSRDVSFCAHAIQRDEAMVVLDATKDQRFTANPLVTGAPFIRFYAGMPLRAPSGQKIGTLCLIDTKPHKSFSASEAQNLSDLTALVLDKLELRRLEIAKQASQFRFENIAATSPDAIICGDENGCITFWNSSAERMFGYFSQEAIGKNISVIAPEGLPQTKPEPAEASDPDRSHVVELDARRRGGGTIPVELAVSNWQEDGRSSFGAILRDITDRRSSEIRLFRLAHLDPLTELPNRTLLKSRIESALDKEVASCIMLVDLDGFKNVNDSLGHAAGDAVLTTVAHRFSGCVRPLDTVARMGGDEFAILIPGLGNPLEAATIADALIAAAAEEIKIDGHNVHIGASVGIAIYPSHGGTADELISGADLALYQAKDEGRHCRRFFTPILRQAALSKRAHQGELRRAYEQGEFELFYQPQVRLEDRTLVGAETLLRWRHPERGIISPAAFLPALEADPLAALVGDWALDAACKQAAVWRRDGAKTFRMGVNLFGAQFRNGDLADRVRAVLARWQLPAEALELEITENIILRHDDEMVGPLRQLHADGVGLAFDDYGTGYASLSMLKRYPLNRLKIDQTFVRDMCQSPEDAAIVRAIIYLGKSFGLEVIAEGVETEEQRIRLGKKGCEEGQGYLFGRPMPANEFSTRFGLEGLKPTLRRRANR